VATPGSDRNGGYQQMPQGSGAHLGYRPEVPYQQRETYTSEQWYKYGPQQSIPQALVDYYNPPVPYQQRETYTFEQWYKYGPLQSTHGMFSVN